MLYPQNGDRLMAIDSVTSLHPLYMATCSLNLRESANALVRCYSRSGRIVRIVRLRDLLFTGLHSAIVVWLLFV